MSVPVCVCACICVCVRERILNRLLGAVLRGRERKPGAAAKEMSTDCTESAASQKRALFIFSISALRPKARTQKRALGFSATSRCLPTLPKDRQQTHARFMNFCNVSPTTKPSQDDQRCLWGKKSFFECVSSASRMNHVY